MTSRTAWLPAQSLSDRLFRPLVFPDQLVFAHPLIPAKNRFARLSDRHSVNGRWWPARRPASHEVFPELPQLSDAFLHRLRFFDMLAEFFNALHKLAEFQHA